MLGDFTDSAAEYAAWRSTVTRTHQRKVSVRVLDIEHGRRAWIERVLDGQVTIDVTNRETTRVANLVFFDPSRALGWEPDSPSSLPLHLRRMVQIIDERMVPGYGWVGCPLFTGPVVEVDREGAEVTVVAEGKERLALGSFGVNRTWEKRRKISEVVTDILILAGEKPSRIHIPAGMTATLPKELNVTRADSPWVHARRLIRSTGREIFYDGRGHVRVRFAPKHPLRPVLDADWLTAPLQLDRPKLDVHNGWIVLGAKPGGKKPRVTSGLVALPKNHDFSAYSQRRNGKWQWRIDEEELPEVKTNAKAREIAERKRDRRIRYAADIAFDILPLPNVEEWDLLKVQDPIAGVAVTHLRQATIPLLEGPMTIGAVKRVSRGKRGGGWVPAQTGGL